MSKVFIQPTVDTYALYRRFADKHDLSLELVDFASPKVINDVHEYHKRETFYLDALSSFKRSLTMHGAFIDMQIHSPIQEIRQIARQIIIKNMETAQKLGAESIVFHTNFNPVIRNPIYRKLWVDASVSFWQEISVRYPTEILLENMWEADILHLQLLMDKLESAQINLCFDTGHHHVFSKQPVADWFAAFPNRITYLHLNDNHGYVDEELAIGDGSINWEQFNDNLRQLDSHPRIVLEVRNLENIKKSIDFCTKHQIYPLN